MLSRDPRGIVFDVTRSDSKMFSYNTLERCKDGRVQTGKYQGYIKEFEIVPVIVFANFEPDTSQLSEDRWHIKRIDKNALQTISEEETTKLHQEYPIPPPKEDLQEEENV